MRSSQDGHSGRADLHLHTTFSDGEYTPEQIVELAQRSGLAAIAITDHDTVDGIAPAQRAAASKIEVVPAIELTAEFKGRELHLLGYFIDVDDCALRSSLQQLHRQRTGRFFAMVDHLAERGLSIDIEELKVKIGGRPPGRRHLAQWLVESKQARSLQQAFHRYLRDGGPVAETTFGLPVERAISLIRSAGGVAVWAHPAYHCRQRMLWRLKNFGLQGIEVEYPGYRSDRVKQLRRLADDMGLVVSGGSDCHGPRPWFQAVGARTITIAELERIRALSRSQCS